MFKNFVLHLSSGLLLLLPAQGALAEEFDIHGSSTVMQALLSPNRDAIEQRSGHTLKLVSKGSDSGVMDLITRAAHIAAISAPLDEVVEKLSNKGGRPSDASWLRSHRIGNVRVAFAVHPENPVRELRLDQVVDILAGRVDNWRQVGGRDAPIQIVAELRGGVRSVVEKMLAERREFMVPPTTVANAVMAAYAVEQLPYAMAITTVAALGHRVVPTTDHGTTVADTPVAAVGHTRKRLIVTDEPIEQPIYLVTFGQPSNMAKTLIRAVRATVQERSVATSSAGTGTITLLTR